MGKWGIIELLPSQCTESVLIRIIQMCGKTKTVHIVQVTQTKHLLLILFSIYKCLLVFLCSEIQGKATILRKKRGEFLIFRCFSADSVKPLCYDFTQCVIMLTCFCPQELVELINANRVLVVSGETGCGKTTQVTQFILDDYINRGMGSMCRVVCTQPRRISAISVCTLQDLQACHLGLFIVVCILRKDAVAKLWSLVMSCIRHLGLMAIFPQCWLCSWLFVCMCVLPLR